MIAIEKIKINMQISSQKEKSFKLKKQHRNNTCYLVHIILDTDIYDYVYVSMICFNLEMMIDNF